MDLFNTIHKNDLKEFKRYMLQKGWVFVKYDRPIGAVKFQKDRNFGTLFERNHKTNPYTVILLTIGSEYFRVITNNVNIVYEFVNQKKARR